MTGEIIAVSTQGNRIGREMRGWLSPSQLDLAPADANEWIKSFRNVDYDGRSMRDRFLYRDDSLWWFTELYLHKTRVVESAVTTILALEAAVAEAAPARIVLRSSLRGARDAAVAFGAARNIPVELEGAAPPAAGLGWPSYQIGLTARLSRLRSAATVDRRPAVAAFVHTAFWQVTGGSDGPHQERYVGAVLDAVAANHREGDLFCIGVGPRRNFRARRWWDPVALPARPSRLVTPIERLAPMKALADSRALWRRRHALAFEITSGDAVHDAARYRGCDLWPLIKSELEAVAMLQWPWSARAMDEAGAALDALRPGAALTYAEAGGWGRAVVLEARRRRIPSIGLQHGFIYRHWLNYRHEPDEMRAHGRDLGCPIPQRTLLFDKFAEAHLLTAGRFPPPALRVTGNARLDDLAARCDLLRPSRATVRRNFGVEPATRLAVLAAKYSEIKRALPDLVEAVRSLQGFRLIIKPHPAETPGLYADAIAGVPTMAIAPAGADLAELLVAADAIVTMNSTVAIDALVLGVPSLVIELPNNLSPFVEAGAMLGANGADAIRRQLEVLLYDVGARRSVLDAGAAFARRYALASDGQAADRAATEILAMAAHPAGQRHV